jgi:hypothetical protein
MDGDDENDEMAAAASWLLQAGAFLESEDALDEVREERRQSFQPRRSSMRGGNLVDESKWWQWLHDPDVRDPRSIIGRKFRRRFRVPYERFVKLVADTRHLPAPYFMCHARLSIYRTLLSHSSALGSWKRDTSDNPVFPDRANVYDRKTIPLEIKILGVLRYLGSGEFLTDHHSSLFFKLSFVGASFELVAECSGCMEAEALRVFTHAWAPLFWQKNHGVWCTMPDPNDGPELGVIMKIFERVGFPGCVGSMDVVHVEWGKCDAAHRSLFTGKEGVPTIAYEVIVQI